MLQFCSLVAPRTWTLPPSRNPNDIVFIRSNSRMLKQISAVDGQDLWQISDSGFSLVRSVNYCTYLSICIFITR